MFRWPGLKLMGESRSGGVVNPEESPGWMGEVEDCSWMSQRRRPGLPEDVKNKKRPLHGGLFLWVLQGFLWVREKCMPLSVVQIWFICHNAKVFVASAEAAGGRPRRYKEEQVGGHTLWKEN